VINKQIMVNADSDVFNDTQENLFEALVRDYNSTIVEINTNLGSIGNVYDDTNTKVCYFYTFWLLNVQYKTFHDELITCLKHNNKQYNSVCETMIKTAEMNKNRIDGLEEKLNSMYQYKIFILLYNHNIIMYIIYMAILLPCLYYIISDYYKH